MEKDDDFEKNDYNPDTDYNGARGIAMADAILRKQGRFKKNAKSLDTKIESDETKSNKLNFINFSNSLQLNPDRIFDSRKDKEDLIRKYGYPKLYSVYNEAQGDFLSKLTDAQLGDLFKRTYYSVKKQLVK